MIMTVAKICGQRWPRLMPPTAAAAYCGMLLSKFRTIPEFTELIQNVNGADVVDLYELDKAIDKILSK
ncbi:MAG: hypothetical protein AB7F32_11645 [Victivallaceae bacterium]